MTELEPAAAATSAPSSHPIRLVVEDDLRRSRLTVLFRLVLALPHFVWLFLWNVAALLAVLAAWVVAVATGRAPDALHDFLASYLRYLTHVYAYASIAADPFPGFTGAPRYPVDVHVDPPAAQGRLGVLFRIVLAVPAAIVSSVLGYLLQVLTILQWFVALFTGQANRGMRDLQGYCLRYQAQTYGYAMLLTSRYPSFGD